MAAALNRAILAELSLHVEAEPDCDLGPLLIQLGNDYSPRALKPRAKRRIRGNGAKRKRRDSDQRGTQTSAHHVVPAGSIEVGHPLSPRARRFFGNGLDPDAFAKAILDGTEVWKYGGKFVTRLGADVIVKYGAGVDLDEAANLRWIRDHDPSILMPECLGSVSIGKANYIFMSFLDGISLDTVWASYTTVEKRSIQSQINSVLVRLRTVPQQTGTALGSLGHVPRCKDNRRHPRTSTRIINDESEFNGFLTEVSDASPTLLRLVRSQLRTDHKIVLTHGDLHPRNIIVSRRPEVRVLGLIDWGRAGWYPDYWEYVRTMSGIHWRDHDDWIDNLPASIGEYPAELLNDLHMDKFSFIDDITDLLLVADGVGDGS